MAGAMHGGAALSGADAWRVVRSNLWLIIGTLVIAAIVGFLANMWLLAKHARYTSTGLINVRAMADLPRSPFDPALDPNPTTLEIEQQTTAKRLTHESLLSTVLSKDDSPIRETEWFKQFTATKNGQRIIDTQAAKQDLLEHLDVIPQPTSRLIEVRMTYSVPKDCKTIIEEICNQYINDEKTRQTAVLNERFETLTRLAENDETKLSELRKRLDSLGEDLGRAGIMPGGQNIAVAVLASMLAEQSKAQELLNEYQGKLDAFKQGMALGNSNEITQALKNDAQYEQLQSLILGTSLQLSVHGPQSTAALNLQ